MIYIYIYNKREHILNLSSELQNLFKPNIFIPAYRRHKNLKDIFASSKFKKGIWNRVVPKEGSVPKHCKIGSFINYERGFLECTVVYPLP